MPAEHEASPLKLKNSSLACCQYRIQILEAIRQHLSPRRRTAPFKKSLHSKGITPWMLKQ